MSDLPGLVARIEGVQERAEKAWAEVAGLCDGTRRWTMRVPVDESRDSDVVIGAALHDTEWLLAAARELLDLRQRIGDLADELDDEADEELEKYPHNPLMDVPIVRDIRAAAAAKQSTADRFRAAAAVRVLRVGRCRAHRHPRERTMSEAEMSEDDLAEFRACTCTAQNPCSEYEPTGCLVCDGKDIYEPCPRLGSGCGFGAVVMPGDPHHDPDCCTDEQLMRAAGIEP